MSKNLNLDDLFDHLNKLNGKLPEPDPYRVLKDFHTTNARGFYGDRIVKRALDQGDKVFKLEDIAEPDDIVPKEDLKLSFNNGLTAVRNYFRKKTKTSSLALQYGGTPSTLQKNFKVTKAVSIRMFTKFFKFMKVSKVHLDNRVEESLKTKRVYNLFGQRYYLPQLADRKTRNQGINKVYNTPIQGGSATLIKIGLVRYSQFIEKYKLSKWQGNTITKLINGEIYNRIVKVDISQIKDGKLEKRLNELKNGHTKVLVYKGNRIVKEYDRCIQLDLWTFKKYKMEILH